jgi:hypothetical protein
MTSVTFGNANLDHWKLSLRGIHPREQVLELTGELRSGFFSATTPMCIAPTVLETFGSELRSLNETLLGNASLQSSNQQSEISCTLVGVGRGHIECVGTFTCNGNRLDFRFRTDQTQLGPLRRWIQKVLTKYHEQDESENLDCSEDE